MPMKDEAMKDETTTLALDFPNGLPRMPAFDPGCRRAPDRGIVDKIQRRCRSCQIHF